MGDPVSDAVEEAFGSRDARVLVGVSGGMDSVVLLHALVQARSASDSLQLGAAHVNYGLRGDDADADEALVRDLCERWNVPLAVRRVRSGVPRSNRQAWARRVRYGWFQALARKHGFPIVTVAHHRDDQAETVILKLLRGAGPDRLGAMAPSRKLGPARLLRPLLSLSRADLRAYADHHQLDWRDDLSNESSAYDRTHVRALLERFGGSAPVARTAGLIGRHYADLITPQLEAVWEHTRKGDALLLEPLRHADPTLLGMVLTRALRRLLRIRPTQARVEIVVRLIRAQKGRRVAFGDAVVWREQDALRFTRQTVVPEEGLLAWRGRVRWNRYSVSADAPARRPHPLAANPAEAWVDAAAPWPLIVRPWTAGDSLRTLGGHTKRISDVLTEAQVPASERASWPVVCAGNDIVWVPGARRASPWLVDADAPAVRLSWRAT